MKIMFYLQSMTAGGTERVVSTLANSFVGRGDEVSIMVIDNAYSDFKLDDRVKLLRQNSESFSKGIINAIISNIHRILVTRKYLKEHKPEIIICFNINKLVTSQLAKVFLGVKIIGSERGNPYRSNEHYFWKKMKQFSSPFADGYIFSTIGASEYYPRITRRKSRIIPNGIFTESIPERVPPLKLRNRNIICASGRLEKVKGFDILIEAFTLFHNKYPEYILNIFGEGSERPNLTKLISDLNMEDSIFLKGYVADIPQRLCESSMFILSSYHEGMPNALIEAMACGLPCIATNCDFGPSDLIINGENGLLVPVGDIEEMAKAMDRLASNLPYSEVLSEKALKIRKTHSLEKISNQFHTYIKYIVKK